MSNAFDHDSGHRSQLLKAPPASAGKTDRRYGYLVRT
jgi:hypothetical protein